MPMMAFGVFRFELNTAAYQDLQRKMSYRWAEVPVVQAAVQHQRIGFGKDEITLKGVIFPHWKGGENQVNAMRGNFGFPHLLVDGSGWIHGRFIMKSLNESQDTFFSNGQFRKQGWDMQLTRYVR